MNMTHLYSLHGVYGGRRDGVSAANTEEQSCTRQRRAEERPVVGPPYLIADDNTAGTACLTDSTAWSRTGGTETLPAGSVECELRHLTEDSDFLLTPDAELCARHRTSLAHVWAWRARHSQQRSPLSIETSERGAVSLSGRLQRGTTGEATLEGDVRRSFHRPCTAADLLQTSRCLTPYPSRDDSSGDLRGHALTAASAPSKPLATSPPLLSSVPTGFRSLDASLLGGLRRGWITELTGLPSTGKTTVAAAWCRNYLHLARSHSVAHNCIWLQSGSVLDSTVLSIPYEDVNATESPPLSEAVHTAFLSSLQDLQRLLDDWRTTDPSTSLLSTVGLIVLDSLTDLVQRSFNYRDDDTLQRHDVMATVLQSLKQLAEEQHTAILVLTQQKLYLPNDSGPPPISYASGSTYETGNNEIEDHAEAGGGEYSTHAGVGAGFGGPPADQGVEDTGQLGRLFLHNVNVRLQLRTCVPFVAGRHASHRSSDVGNPEGSGSAMRLRWQLELLKSPVSAPFAVALRLRAPPPSPSAQSPPWVPGPPLCVEEIDDDDCVSDGNSGGLLPPAQKLKCEEGLPLLSLDPWDYTDVPSFLYL